jgi:phosphoglucosamine mutase
MKLFGTDGVRAVFGEEPLTRATITRLSQVIADRVSPENRLILMGRDTRQSGVPLAQWIQSAWTEFNIVDLGCVPTPVVAYETSARKGALGVMITASHNPYQDNGLKFFSGRGTKVPGNTLESWTEAMSSYASSSEWEPVVAVRSEPVHYEAFLKKHFKPLNLNVVFDLAHGAGCPWVERWIKYFFPAALVTGNNPNGSNINAQCGALHPEELGRIVRANRALAGFAFDGDGDRLVVVDGRGNALHGDRILYALSKLIEGADHVVTTIMAGLGLEQTLAAEGRQMTRTGVGDQQVLAAMQRYGALVGGEPSGHYISGDLFPAGDGFLNAMRLAGALAHDCNFLSALENQLPVYPQYERALPVRHKPPLSEMPAMTETLNDLVSSLGNSGRCILRYSGTEKKIRLFVEAQDMSLYRGNIDALEKAIEEELQ